MQIDETRIRLDVQNAETHDLLDRATAFRSGMLPQALRLIEEELFERGIEAEEIADRKAFYDRNCLRDAYGIAKACSLCRRPAVATRRSWVRWRPGYRLFGLTWGVPLFPRRICVCEQHREES